MNGNLQYLADTRLIHNLFLIDAGLHKKAGAMDFLSSISSSVMDFGKEHVDTSSSSSILSSLASIMLPGVLFKINPLLGGLATVAQVLGFNPISIVRNILRLVKGKLDSNELPTMQEVNQVGKDAVSSEAGPMEEGLQSENMFDYLHQIEKRGNLVVLAYGNLDIPFFGNSKAGIIERVFGNLFQMKAQNKAKWLLGGFVVWIIKTLLLGAGLIAAGEGIKHLIQGPSTPSSGASHTKPEETSTVVHLTPTGNGQDKHVNDHTASTWVVPMINNSIEDTLLTWAGDVYKELRGQEHLIEQTDSFNKTVNDMKAGLESSSNHLTVPTKFKSRKQVVDQFAQEASNKLGKQ